MNPDRFIVIDIDTHPGEQVYFAHPTNGHPSDKAFAQKLLVHGYVYTVAFLDVHSCSSTLYLREFPGIGFNSVQFQNVIPKRNRNSRPPTQITCHDS
jgi:hypothetical protein